MEVVELPVNTIQAPSWNPNSMDDDMASKLSRSIQRYGFIVPIVVCDIGSGQYETVGGAQRLATTKALGFKKVPCIVVTADGTEARLLSQALNCIQGEDDLGLRAEIVREILEELPESEILGLLPESTNSLNALVSLGQQDISSYLETWEQAQAARLRHLQFQLLPSELEVVEEALARLMPEARKRREGSPNAKGTALYLLCRAYLKQKNEADPLALAASPIHSGLHALSNHFKLELG